MGSVQRAAMRVTYLVASSGGALEPLRAWRRSSKDLSTSFGMTAYCVQPSLVLFRGLDINKVAMLNTRCESGLACGLKVYCVLMSREMPRFNS